MQRRTSISASVWDFPRVWKVAVFAQNGYPLLRVELLSYTHAYKSHKNSDSSTKKPIKYLLNHNSQKRSDANVGCKNQSGVKCGASTLYVLGVWKARRDADRNRIRLRPYTLRVLYGDGSAVTVTVCVVIRASTVRYGGLYGRLTAYTGSTVHKYIYLIAHELLYCCPSQLKGLLD